MNRIIDSEGATWAGLDDESLGRAVKGEMLSIKTISIGKDKLPVLVAAILLCNIAAEANTDELKISLNGVTRGGAALWQLASRN